MRIVPLKKDRYLYIKELIKKLIDLNAFSLFTPKDIFLINDKKTEYAIAFIKEFGQNSYGISFFVDKEGLNTLHDMFSIEDKNSLNLTDFSTTNIMFIEKKNLLENEIKYLNKNDIKIKNKDNLLLKTYKKGYASYISTTKEADIVIQLLLNLILIIQNDLDYLLEGFTKELCANVVLDYRAHNYSICMDNIPYLERKYNVIDFSKEEANEFKDLEFSIEQATLMLKNIEIPLKISECNKGILPLFILYDITDRGIVDCETVTTTPLEYRNILIHILKDFFSNHGLPKKLIINDRKMFYELYSLLTNLGIELILQRENDDLDMFINNINYATVNFLGSNINTQGEYYITDEEFRDLFSFIKKMINYSGDIYEMEDGEELKMNLFSQILENEVDLEDDDIEEDYEESDTYVS